MRKMSRLPVIAIFLLVLSFVSDAATVAPKENGLVLDKAFDKEKQTPNVHLKAAIIKSAVQDKLADTNNQDTKRTYTIGTKNEGIVDKSSHIANTQPIKKDQKGKSKVSSKKKMKQMLAKFNPKIKQRRWNNNLTVRKIINAINAHNKKGKGSLISTRNLRRRLFKPTFWKYLNRRRSFPKSRRKPGSRGKVNQLKKSPTKTPQKMSKKSQKSMSMKSLKKNPRQFSKKPQKKMKSLKKTPKLFSKKSQKKMPVTSRKKIPKKNLRWLKRPDLRNQLKKKILQASNLQMYKKRKRKFGLGKPLKKGTVKTTSPKQVNKSGLVRQKGKGMGRKKGMVGKGMKNGQKKRKNGMAFRLNRMNRFKGRMRGLKKKSKKRDRKVKTKQKKTKLGQVRNKNISDTKKNAL